MIQRQNDDQPVASLVTLCLHIASLSVMYVKFISLHCADKFEYTYAVNRRSNVFRSITYWPAAKFICFSTSETQFTTYKIYYLARHASDNSTFKP